MDLLEANNQLKHAHQQLNASQQNNVAKGGIDEQQRKEIEAQLVQMEEFKKQLDNQAKAIESERKLFEEQRYAEKKRTPIFFFLDVGMNFELFYIFFMVLLIHRKAIESKRKELEEKEKKLIEFDRQLQKRKEQMDQLEKSLQKVK